MSNQKYVNLLHSYCLMVSFTTYNIRSVIIEHENFRWLPYIIIWKIALIGLFFGLIEVM